MIKIKFHYFIGFRRFLKIFTVKDSTVETTYRNNLRVFISEIITVYKKKEF